MAKFHMLADTIPTSQHHAFLIRTAGNDEMY
jgi:hypothetical protein